MKVALAGLAMLGAAALGQSIPKGVRLVKNQDGETITPTTFGKDAVRTYEFAIDRGESESDAYWEAMAYIDTEWPSSANKATRAWIVSGAYDYFFKTTGHSYGDF